MPLNEEEPSLNGHPQEKKRPSHSAPPSWLNPERELVDLSRLAQRALPFIPAAIAGAALGSIVGLLAHSFAPKTYSSMTLVEFTPAPMEKVFNPLSSEAENRVAAELSKKALEPYLVLCTSYGVMELTNRKLQANGIPPEKAQFYINNIPYTNFLTFEARSENPTVPPKAALLWEASAIEYISNLAADNSQISQSTLNHRYQANKKTLADLQSQVDLLKPQLELNEEELRIKNKQLLAYFEESNSIKSQIEEAQINLPALKEEIKKHTPASKDMPYAVNISNDKVGNSIKLLSYGSIYDELEKKIMDAELAYKTLPMKENLLRKNYEKTSAGIKLFKKNISTQRIRLADLERDFDVAQKEYNILNTSLGQTNLTGSINLNNLRRISPPSPDASPISKKKTFLLIGGMLGALLGFGIRLAMKWNTKPQMTQPKNASPSKISQLVS